MKCLYALPLCLSLIIMTGCNAPTFGWEREDNITIEEGLGDSIDGIDGPTNGHFDDDGNWIPNNPAIEMTYRIPDISAGFIFDAAPIVRKDKRWWDGLALPAIQIELFEWDTNVPYINTLKFDFGVGYKRVYFYTGKLWTNIFEISTGAFIGWDWDANDLSYGLGATIIKF